MNTTGLNRNTIDKFYTKKDIVNLCMNEIIKLNFISPESSLIIEPSSGNGAFVKSIQSLSNNHLFIDIEPENEEYIIQMDYLTFDINKFLMNKNYEKIHIIGNPPFGRQSSLANKFIKKSCEFCDSLSFILPKSFKKDSMKKVFPLNFHLIFEMDLPKESFLVNNVSYDVPCIFQVWIKRSFNREINEKIEPEGYRFVKQNESPDISFRRVGVNAGTISQDINKSVQSHYFIKFNNENSLEDNLKKLSSIKFHFDNTVGPKSISKPELIFEFNKVLNL